MKAWGGCNQEETSPQKHCPGMQEQKVKTQNGNWWVMWKVTRRAFTGTVATRGRASDIVGNSLTQGVHRADALSAFFISVFTGKVRLPELPCLVEGEMFYLQQQNIRVGTTYTNCTHTRVDGTRWVPSEWTLRNQVKAIPRLLSVISAIWWGPHHKKKGKCHTCLQRAEERGWRKLRANQPHLSPWKCYRTNSPRNHFEL